MEACLSEWDFCQSKWGLEEGLRTVGWIQRDVGHFYKYLGRGRGGDGDGVERWGTEEARHEGFHGCGFHIGWAAGGIEGVGVAS